MLKKELEVQMGVRWAYEILSGRWNVTQEEIVDAVKALKTGIEATTTNRFRGWYMPMDDYRKRFPVLKFCIKLQHPELR